VIPRLHKLDLIGPDTVNKTMFLVDAAAPAASLRESQRLGFADAHEGVSENGGHQVEETERGFSVRLNPIPQIVLKITGDHRNAICWLGHKLDLGLDLFTLSRPTE
jgi:hypothetical protein